MHTARSRNDQVVTDTRMVCREEINNTIETLIYLKEVLLELAKKHSDTLMPGYTHLYPAQPTTFGHWCLAYYDAFGRDVERLEDSYKRVNSCPLGAVAFSGTSFPIDRELTAKLLGFDTLVENSLDAIASRDFVVEALANLAILASNLSRFCEDLIIFSTREFGYIEFSDEYMAGSSIMPQKKNKDVEELIRGRTGIIYGNLYNILTNLKGLPYSYNRDMQEDKPPLWSSFDTMDASLSVLPGMLSSMTLDKDVMKNKIPLDIFGSAIVDAIVQKGLQFATAYEVVGNILKDEKFQHSGLDKEKLKGKLNEKLKEFELQFIKNEFDEIVSPKKCVESKCSLGSSNPKEVIRMVKERKNNIELEKHRLIERKEKIVNAFTMTQKIVWEQVSKDSPISDVNPYILWTSNNVQSPTPMAFACKNI